MTVLLMGGLVTVIGAFLTGGIVGSVKLMEFIQNSGKALALGETLGKEVEKLQSRIDRLESEAAKVEAKHEKEIEGQRAQITLLLTQNQLLIEQKAHILEQNTYLMGLLGAEETPEDEPTDGD